MTIQNTMLSKEYETLSDEELLRNAQKNPKYFEFLITRYDDAFKRKARSIIGAREEVDDIVQETFLKIYMNAERFKVVEGASFKSWGYKILMNTTFTYYQKLKKHGEATVHLDPEIFDALPDEREEVTGELSDFVASVLVRMPRHLARVLELHFIEGMPQKEMGELLGVSQSAVKTRVHRAKKEYKKISENING